MVRLRVLEILEEQNHTKYWLYKQMNLSYQNFNRMITNQTSSIRFENLDLLSNILHCPIGDLFEKINEHIEQQVIPCCFLRAVTRNSRIHTLLYMKPFCNFPCAAHIHSLLLMILPNALHKQEIGISKSSCKSTLLSHFTCHKNHISDFFGFILS